MSDEHETQKSEVAKQEEETLRFWQEHDIFWKSLAARKDGPRYAFYDGPPFATGTPHYGHILASTIKDAVPRYQTMRGKYVERRWGWDTHGLPIENIVEKDLKISGKKDIERLGIAAFNDYARSKVLEYVAEWKRTIERMARWVDFDGSYKTMDNTYIESVWWALSELHKRGLTYEGTRVLPYCPRCETPIAQSEIAMDNSYKDITDLSVYVTFPLNQGKGPSLLVWTTTPWTLPGNTGLAINPKLTYLEVEYFRRDQVEHYILAKDRLAVLGPEDGGLTGEDRWEVIREVSAAELIGQSYLPLFTYFAKADLPHKDNIWKIHPADYVLGDEGTGVVHLSPPFGVEDMALAEERKFPGIWHVDATGRFTQEVTDFTGLMAKPKDDHQQTDVLIIKHLAAVGRLFKKEKILHAYPHCFRCETPLYYYAIPAWFVRIQTVKDQLLAANKQIDWIPGHLKEGRFGKSMAGAPDWNISRNRYWASPLPIWKCEKCQATRFVRSVAELGDQLDGRNTFYFLRHGDATKNHPDINTSAADGFPLTAAGQAAVASAARELADKKVTRIITSPTLRTRQTAELLAEFLKTPVTIDERFLEIRTGQFEGQPREAYRAFFESEREMWRRRPSGGENREDVFRRVRDAVIDLNTHHRGEVFVIVSHGDPLWFLKAWLEGQSLPDGLAATAYPERGRAFQSKVREIDLHRPWIDEITFSCADCPGLMRRIPEVFDCWFESGSMPFAAVHYPFENEDFIQENFPGDFVAEYIAQTRTWFYYMHVLSVTLFDSIPFKHVVTTGNILAEDGQKMSKSKQNYPDPWLLFNRYGVDALRFYLLVSPVMRSEDINFSEKGVDEVFKKIILRLGNVVSFYTLYPADNRTERPTGLHLLDRWLIARLAETVRRVTDAMERYELDAALRPLEELIDDLSVWYVRRSRERFRAEAGGAGAACLRQVLAELAKLLAPFTPCLAERVYQATKRETDPESVHLADWPRAAQDVDNQILEEMAAVRRSVELGHAARNQAGIRVRQPLQGATLTGQTPFSSAYEAIFLDELNLKTVAYEPKGELAVRLETVLTPELRREGLTRELVRTVQAFRKDHQLAFGQRAVVMWQTDQAELVAILESSAFTQALSGTMLRRSSIETDGTTYVFGDGKLTLRLVES